MSNFVDNANATALMGAVEESIANTRIFPGTLDEYDALTPEEKAKYKYIATPDQEVVTKNNLEAEIADIVNVYGAKNLIPYPYYRPSGYTSGNMTGTYDANGVITINKTVDTTTRYFALYNGEPFLLPNTTYTLSLELTNATNTSVYVAIGTHGVDMTAIRNKATGKYDVTFTTPSTFDDNLIIGLYYGKDIVETNAIVKVMLRLASIQDDTYVPYVPTNKELLSCKLNGYVGAKNLLAYPYKQTTKVENGITFTDNGDGTVTVRGTASAETRFYIHTRTDRDYILDNGCYCGTGCPQGGSILKYYIEYTRTKNNTFDYYGRDFGDGLVFTVNGDDSSNDNAAVQMHIVVKTGTSITTPITFKPMIRRVEDTDPTWVPYAKTNKELTDNLKVKTIELTNQTTSSDGKLILTGVGHKMAIVSSRLLDDSNNHLIVPFGFCYSSNGDALFALVDNSTNAIITSSITLSGTMEYIDLS